MAATRQRSPVGWPQSADRSLICANCGFEATADSDDRSSVEHPPIGTLAKCPECGSTGVSGQL
jgi:DNA-directed RNA polymerase subunit RPC12/RpoP